VSTKLRSTCSIKKKIDKNLIVESTDGQFCQGLFTKEKSRVLVIILEIKI